VEAVLRTVSTYLPRCVMGTGEAGPAPPAVVGAFVQATLLFVDIAGFTAMSERLSQLGREGAEVITGVVNDYFAAMLEILSRYGGDLLKFGGDALLACFRGEDSAAYACQAGLEMQQAMDRFAVIETVQGTFSLRMTAGLGTGTLFLASLGSAERLEIAVMGPTLEQMARAEDLAEAGQIILDRATYQAVCAQAVAGECAPGFYHLTALPGLPPCKAASEAGSGEPVTQRQPHDLVQALDSCTPYLPPGILEQIVASPGRRMIEGEHRLVTVLFANFYGINQIIAALGPDRADEITAILNQHFTTMQEVIRKYGGIVNKVDSYAVGHRIMALFGAPIAHEDDPARAVRAAWEMQEAMEAFADLVTSAGRFALKQRIGINTGYVFAGNLGSVRRQEYSVMGDEVNLASRLMGVAGEGQIVASGSTARHVESLFELDEQAPVQVKGKSQAVRNFQVGPAIASPRGLGAAPGQLFGRQKELEKTQALVGQALAGQGGVLDLSGERGVGKTRLIEALCGYARERGAQILSGTAFSYGYSIPYLPWVAVLHSLLGWTADDESPERRRDALVAALDPLGLSEWSPIVGRVLGLEIQENSLTASLTAQMRQQRFFDIVLQLIQGQAARCPLLLALDDMQWADAVSPDLAAYVARNVRGSPLLLIVAHWPNAALPNLGRGCQVLHLEELDEQAALALARSTLQGTDRPAELSPALCDLLLERTQGNPLFVQEVARALRESGGIRLEDGEEDRRAWIIADEACCAEVPTTLAGLVMSRIDRLEATNRRLLQVSSVIGVTFRVPTLARIYPYEDLDGTLGKRLAHMSQLDLVFPSLPGGYTFRHTLTQEVAYESLSFARRRELHGRVGQEIEQQHASDLVEQYGVLAHHFERGHVFDKAFHYLTRAGSRAQAEFANQAALDYYGRALQIAAGHEALGLGSARVLDTLEAMGDIYLLISLYAEAIDRFEQAISHPLCSPLRQGDLWRKIARAHELQGQYDEALHYLDRGREALAPVAREQRSATLASICALSGWVHMRRGEVKQAIHECEQGVTLVAELARDQAALGIEADLYRTLGTIYADLQGNYAAAAEACQRSTDLLEEAGDLPGLARSYNNLARIAWAQGDLGGAGDYMRRSLDISRKIGDHYLLALGHNNLGVIAYTTGGLDEALDHYRAALLLRQRIGDNHGIAQTCSNIGEALMRLERYKESRRYLEQAADAFAAIQSEGELPEVYCLLAEVELAQENTDGALGYGEQAQRIAAATGNTQLQGMAERALAQGYAQAGETAEARRAFEASIRLLRASGHQAELARSHYAFGLFLSEQEEQEKDAREQLEQAAELFAAAGADKEAALARDALAGRVRQGTTHCGEETRKS
jgi:class 3 adenylate cyclase/predicted ATPase